MLFALGQLHLFSVAMWLIIAYLIGSIPIGFLIGRARGIDLRTIGSGNIGATNAGRALGRSWGLFVFFLDVLKSAGITALAKYLFRSPLPETQHLAFVAAVGVAAFLGHIYPIYLRFRGGKGVACALGVAFVIYPAAGLGALLIYLQTLWLTRVSAIGSLTGVSTMSVIVLVTSQPAAIRFPVLLMAAIIWWRHRSNLKDILAKRPAKSSEPSRHSPA